MVVTVMWMHSWTVVIISVCVLATIIALLLCCICWESKRNSLRHFYILDENGMKIVGGSDMKSHIPPASDCEKGISLFRHLSTGSFKTNLSFLSNKNATSKVLSTTERKKYSSRSDLTQSMEIADKFDNAVLRLEENEGNLPLNSAASNLEEDVQSCISNDSKHTFYSTYHIARTVSVADTIRSALSHSDLNGCVN